MNHVKKVIRYKDVIVFIIQTDEEQDFWWWEVTTGDWFGYWGKYTEVTPKTSEEFANDLKNDTIGTSCGDYATIEEILEEFKEFWK